MTLALPREVEEAILDHARERRTCLGVVARHVVTGSWRVVRMRGATAKDVRRLYRDLMAHAEYIEAVYRGAPLPRVVAGMEDEDAPYVLVDSVRMRLRGAWRMGRDDTWTEEPVDVSGD